MAFKLKSKIKIQEIHNLLLPRDRYKLGGICCISLSLSTMAHHHHYHNHPSDQDSITNPAPIVVLMVPFSGQSHLNQALQFSCLIASYQIQVHYAASAIHNRQVKLRFNGGGGDPSSVLAKIRFHDLPLPPFLSPLPDPTSKFPSHLQPAFDATVHLLRDPVAALLRELSASARRVVVIHDSLMYSVVQDVATIPNAESYAFPCVSAFSVSCILCLQNGLLNQIPVQVERIPPIEQCFFAKEMITLAAAQSEFVKIKHGDILNTSRQIESFYLHLLAKNEANVNKKQWAIPIAPLLNQVSIYSSSTNANRNECLLWLDKQKPKSVMYVSFGSTTSMTNEQIGALAIGLKESKQRFLWVLRDADRGDIFTGEVRNLKLPNGFEESVMETGIIVRDWVPQVEILAHPSLGAFMSHCGWNSSMESMSRGVPIAAWPIHSDQPYNALFITQILKVGIEVREWADQSEVVSSSTIAKAVEKLMASEEGEHIRKRAEELGSVLRQEVEEGGVSRVEMDSFIAHINK